MSLAAIERGIRPSSLTVAETNNPFIRSYVAVQAGFDSMQRLGRQIKDTFSQPLTSVSPLREEEYPSQADIDAAVEATSRPAASWIKLASRFALPGGTLLAAACSMAPQEVNKPAIVEPARPTATAVGIGAVFVPTGNEEIDNIQKRLLDPATKAQVPEEDILKFNEAIIKRGQTPPESQKAAKPEMVQDPTKCVFIKDLAVCVLGQPRTRVGREDRILGIQYNDISGTPIYAKAGDFSPQWDNTTQKIVGVTVDFPDGSKVNISADDLVLENPRVRKVTDDEVVARVGPSGQVNFSTGAKLDPTTGDFVTPQSFFENNFPVEVLKKPKDVRAAASGTPQVVITKAYN